MANKTVKRWAAGLLAGLLAAGALAGCGAGAEDNAQQNTAQEDTAQTADTENEEAVGADADEDTEEETQTVENDFDALSSDYTYFLDAGTYSIFYEEYEDGPIYTYWADMEWDADGDGTGKKISIDFTAPISGTEQDTLNTMMATGEYCDIISASYLSSKPSALYEEGTILDLTDYVEQYMPNYMSWMEANPTYADQLYNVIDGEKKIIQIYGLVDQPENFWGGFVYRRDWIVKYGKNPKTGEAFSGGWDGDEWTDDVVFPSGNTDPVYISDWEWMLQIFADALEDLNEPDGYPYQLYYTGFTGGGSDFVSGFGVGSAYYYLDEDGVCQFGMDSDGVRAYLECMSNWYAKGWVDPYFEENTSDMMFWKVDTPSIYSGIVGCWYGTSSQLGAELSSNGGAAEGAVVYPAPQPINDIYGTAAEQGKEPTAYFTTANMIGQSIVLSDKMAEKDIPTFLTALDYLYTEEGGLLRKGFSKEEQGELQNDFYNEWGLEDGIYWIEDGTIYMNPARLNEEGLEVAAGLGRVVGLNINSNLDTGEPPLAMYAYHEVWTRYPFTGNVPGTVESQMSPEQAEETSLNTTNIRTFQSQVIPEFIIGERNIMDDAAWESFCEEVNAYDPQAYVTYVNEILGK